MHKRGSSLLVKNWFELKLNISFVGMKQKTKNDFCSVDDYVKKKNQQHTKWSPPWESSYVKPLGYRPILKNSVWNKN